MKDGILAFNSERRDPLSGTTHLGNGYRAYNPVSMRFHGPDAWSPFREGGINPYAYCAGDPVGRADPSGHHSVGGWLSIGLGVALGALLTPISAGTSLAAALSLLSFATAVASTGLAIGQQCVEASDPKAGAILGWAALATGIVSGLSSVALSRVAPEAPSLAGLLKGTGNRPIGGLMISGSGATAATEQTRTGSLYTSYANIQLARQADINRGFGNCEYVAKRAFSTLLTGSSSRQRPFQESLMGIKKYIDNFFPFRRLPHPAALYEGMLRKIIPAEGPFPEINTITFSSKSSMDNALKKASPFSVFWATSMGEFMGTETNHAFIIARGMRPEEYYIFDRFSATSHRFATHEPDRYFDAFNEFEVELTGFL